MTEYNLLITSITNSSNSKNDISPISTHRNQPAMVCYALCTIFILLVFHEMFNC